MQQSNLFIISMRLRAKESSWRKEQWERKVHKRGSYIHSKWRGWFIEPGIWLIIKALNQISGIQAHCKPCRFCFEHCMAPMFLLPDFMFSVKLSQLQINKNHCSCIYLMQILSKKVIFHSVYLASSDGLELPHKVVKLLLNSTRVLISPVERWYLTHFFGSWQFWCFV